MNEVVQEEDKNLVANKEAWLVLVGEHAHFDNHILTIDGDTKELANINESAWFVLVDTVKHITSVCRSFRRRQTLTTSMFYADKEILTTNEFNLDEFELMLPESSIYRRLKWPDAERVITKVSGCRINDVPLIRSHIYIREIFQAAIVDDLLGPANGPHEDIVDMGVKDRYLVGKLAPMMKDDNPNIEGVQGSTAVEENEEEPDNLEIHTGRHEPGAELGSTTGRNNADADSSDEIDTTSNQSLVPSSVGLTFCIDGDVKEIEIEVRWGKYERLLEHEHVKKRKNRETGEDEYIKPRVWRRVPRGGIVKLPVVDGILIHEPPDKENPEVRIQGTIRAPNSQGDRLITLFLVNTEVEPGENKDTAWVFQPEVKVRASKDTKILAIFRRRPFLESNLDDKERRALEMIYRRRVEFAVGHGISTHATLDETDPTHATEIRTAILPEYEVAVTETPGFEANDRPAMRRLNEEGRLVMATLAKMEKAEVIETLGILIDDYDAWIREKQLLISSEFKDFESEANEALLRCEEILLRLKEGMEVLNKDDNALKAFRFANKAMGLQRIYSQYALAKRRNLELSTDVIKDPKNATWRPFQLAFLILNIPSLTNPLHSDRTKYAESNADLLWFPTGGGKTEAYLGIAAFTMAMRRLQNNLGDYDASRGLGVVMRYTLRLLTIQQFQRATTLICAMEILRIAEEAIWGSIPFTIGLWVGNKVTPGTTKDSSDAISALRNDARQNPTSSPAQLTSCPVCGSKINPAEDIEADVELGSTYIFCPDRRCKFSRNKSSTAKHPGLPVLVVDEEIYHRPPSMMIATVDKFAMMAWRGDTRTMFGISEFECTRHGLLWPSSKCNGRHSANPQKGLERTEPLDIKPLRPPDLIIQDEFHLISGPLGTMVGLYETAVDELCSWQLNGTEVRPKIIASTATVRKASEQIKNVFLRRVAVFPPHGLDVEDNFFSLQRSLRTKPGRRYLGICSPGSSRPAVLIRVYTALLTASQALFNKFGDVVDPYMTTVGYFNSLRELGGMKRLAEDDVSTRAYRVEMSLVKRPGLAQRSLCEPLELTSRVSSQAIPGFLDRLENTFQTNYDASTERFEVIKNKDTPRGVDLVLATNMLSVGVDVNRLGLMAVNGQPKGTAEYIQSTSRVGRQYPGIIFTVLTWSRPRDLSHYESFEHYHATFYKHVEAQSVTPFSPRALDRGMTGTLLSLVRLRYDNFNPNEGASELVNVSDEEIGKARGLFENRAWRVSQKHLIKTLVSDMLKTRIDKWHDEASIGGRSLVYEIRGQTQGTQYQLLSRPGLQSWQTFTTPQSMREVEPSVRLIMNPTRYANNPQWNNPSQKKASASEDHDESEKAFLEINQKTIEPGMVITAIPPGETLAKSFRFIDNPESKPEKNSVCLIVHPNLKQKGVINGIAYGKITWMNQQDPTTKSNLVHVKIRRPNAPAMIQMTKEEWENFTCIALKI